MGQNSVLVCIALVLARAALCFAGDSTLGMSGTYPFDLDFHLDVSSSEINGEIASNLTKSNLAVSGEFGTCSAPLDMGDIMGAITTPLGASKLKSEVSTYPATDAATAAHRGVEAPRNRPAERKERTRSAAAAR